MPEINEERYKMETLDQLAKKAIGLQPIERIRLVEAILHSLDRPDLDIEKSKRYKSIRLIKSPPLPSKAGKICYSSMKVHCGR
jgi:hypothetical protein